MDLKSTLDDCLNVRGHKIRKINYKISVCTVCGVWTQKYAISKKYATQFGKHFNSWVGHFGQKIG